MLEDIFQTMNTVVQIKMEGKDEKVALAEAKAIILDIEKRFNFFSETSEISRLCKNIHVGERYLISEDLYQILLTAKEVKKKTGGLFDVDFENKEKGRDYHLTSDGSIIFDSKKTRINLGAIAKGFAADKAIKAVTEFDVDRIMISLGGQISCFSQKEAWKIGLQDPTKDFGQVIGVLEIKNGSLSTSAENYRGRHIKSPVRKDWQSSVNSLSVFNFSGTLADAYSTALFLADRKVRQKLVQENNLDIIIIEDKKVRLSLSLAKKFNLKDDRYKIEELMEGK